MIIKTNKNNKPTFASILFLILLFAMHCVSEPQKDQTVNGLNGDSFYELTTTTKYSFDGNIQGLKKEINQKDSANTFLPENNVITGIVTLRSNWEYEFSTTLYNGSFTMEDKNDAILVLYKSDEEGIVHVGDKITLTITAAAKDSKQALVSSFEKDTIIIHESFVPVYTKAADDEKPALATLNQTFTIEGVVQNTPVIKQDMNDNFSYMTESAFTSSIKSDDGTIVNFQLGQDLVRGSMDGFSFGYLGLTKFILEKGQRVQITGPTIYTNNTLKIAIENKTQVVDSPAKYLDEVSALLAIYDPVIKAVRLSWLNPTNSKGVLIKRSYKGFPLDPLSDTNNLNVFKGQGNFAYDYNLTPGTTAQYTAFAYDDSLNFSKGSDSSRAYAIIPGSTIDGNYPGNCTFIINEIGIKINPQEYNGDGKHDAEYEDDEFIEIVNKDCGKIDITNWKLLYKDEVRHIFSNGVILDNMESAVVFGGGKPKGTFGASYVTTVNGSEGSLGYSIYGLSSSSGSVSLEDSYGNTIDSKSYYNFSGNSLVRSPDITGDFVVNSDATIMTPGTMTNGDLFNPDSKFKIQPNSGTPENGGSISVQESISLSFNLPILASSVNTNTVKLYNDIASCSLSEVDISVSVSSTSNILTIKPNSDLLADNGYCIKISDDFQSDTSSIAGNDTKLESTLKFLFTTNSPETISIRQLRDIAEGINVDDSIKVNYKIEKAIVSYVSYNSYDDENQDFYIQKENDAGILVSDSNNFAVSCSGILLNAGDVIDIAILELDRSWDEIESASQVVCLKKYSSSSTITPIDVTNSFIDESIFGSSVSITGILISKATDCNTEYYCKHTIQGLYDQVHVYQSETEKSTSSYKPFDSFSEGDFVKVTAPLTEHILSYDYSIQFDINSSMGTVSSAADIFAPKVEKLSLSGSNVPWNATTLVFTFDENISTSNLKTTQLSLNNGVTISSVSATANKLTFTVALPAKELEYSGYLSKGIEDLQSNATLYNYNFSFSTIDPVSIQMTDHLVISEVGNSIDGSSSNDYIELFNPTDSPISLNGLYIGRDSGCSISAASWTEFDPLPNVSIPSHEFYLIGKAANYIIPDWSTDWSGSIGDGYCIALTNTADKPTTASDSNIVDFFSSNSSIAEGTYAGPLVDGSAYGRKACGVDSNDNSKDFSLVSPNPLTSAAPSTDAGSTCE